MKEEAGPCLLALVSKAVLDLDPIIGEIAAFPGDLGRVIARMVSNAADAGGQRIVVPILRHHGR